VPKPDQNSAATTEPDDAAGDSQPAGERMFIMFVRPIVVHPIAATRPDGRGPGMGAGAVGKISIDTVVADEPSAMTTAEALKAFAESSKKAHPIPRADTFAADLYRRLAGKRDGNILFSPVSIHTALAMTYGGAAGETAKQMAAVCYLTGKPTPAQAKSLFSEPAEEQIHSDFAGLLAALNNPRWGPRGNPVYKLTVANALWAQKEYPFKVPFTDMVKKNYGAELTNVDFIGQRDSAAKAINRWVARQTKGKIDEIVAPDSLTDATRLVLTNAVYFKGAWANKFLVTDTHLADFTLAGGKKVRTPFMRQTGEFGYLVNDQFWGLSMDYLGGDMSMIVLLPRKPEDMAGLEKSLTGENLTQWCGQLQKREIEVSLPKFKFTSGFSVKETMKALGMTDAFDMKLADFSGMAASADTKEPPLYISDVLHKAFVAVDEEGTEAAAATAVAVVAGGIAVPPPTFIADHPFIFLIRHNATGSILFIGRVANPATE
jgi:serpin B